jgi:hypothetical protein
LLRRLRVARTLRLGSLYRPKEGLSRPGRETEKFPYRHPTEPLMVGLGQADEYELALGRHGDWIWQNA